MRHLWLLAFVFVPLLIACTPQATPQAVPAPAPQAALPVPSAPLPAKAAWEGEWERWVNAAKAEGRVVLYSTAGAEPRAVLMRVFKERYGLELEIIIARGAQISEKLLSERRAGLYLVDVYMGGSSTPMNQLKPAGALEPLEPALLLPEVVDPKAWYGGAHLWIDKDHTVLTSLAYPNTPIAINTTLAKAEEIKSYKDLLNPKWKGKILMNDPTVAGIGAKTFAVIGNHLMGWDFWRELVKQEPTVLRDQRLQGDWLARGKYSILLFPDPPVITEMKAAGATLEYVIPVEGAQLSAGSGNIALVNRAAHPNAARVFINWFLGKEGQTLFGLAYGAQSARVDAPVEGLDPMKTRRPGIKYFPGANTEEWVTKEPEYMKMAKEILGPLVK